MQGAANRRAEERAMSWERKQPKRETALVQLKRQARAIEKLVKRHNNKVYYKLDRVDKKLATHDKKRFGLHDARGTLFACFVNPD